MVQLNYLLGGSSIEGTGGNLAGREGRDGGCCCDMPTLVINPSVGGGL